MMLAMPLQAQSPYFCDREGTVLHYERRHADSGKLKWTHEMTIASVTETPDGCLAVSYESEFRRPGRREDVRRPRRAFRGHRP